MVRFPNHNAKICTLKRHFIFKNIITHKHCDGKSPSQARAAKCMSETEAGDIPLTGLSV